MEVILSDCGWPSRLRANRAPLVPCFSNSGFGVESSFHSKAGERLPAIREWPIRPWGMPGRGRGETAARSLGRKPFCVQFGDRQRDSVATCGLFSEAFRYGMSSPVPELAERPLSPQAASQAKPSAFPAPATQGLETHPARSCLRRQPRFLRPTNSGLPRSAPSAWRT